MNQELSELAVECALKGGRLALEMRASGCVDTASDSKSSLTDLVTEADREVEKLIHKIVSDQRPDDSFFGEEAGAKTGTSDLRWVVDPIDGTVSYYYQFPGWVVSVAVESIQTGLLAGAVYDPTSEELYEAYVGGGARLNGQAIAEPKRVEPTDISQALVATGFGYQADRRKQQAEMLVKLLPEIRDIRRAGAAAMDLCHVAAGRVDAYFERGLKPWDYSAGIVIAQESGCIVELLEQNDTESFLLAARSQVIFDQLKHRLLS